MVIGHGNVLGIAGEAAHLDVFADDQHLLLLLLLHGMAGGQEGQLHQSLQVGGVLLGHNLGNALDKFNKKLVAADEVGFGVDLNHNTHAVLHVRIGDALGGNAARLLLRGGQTLFTQVLNGLVHVSVRGHEGLFAVHHSHAGHLAQVLYILCTDCHL
ncbi:hypothetical protein SDC9_188423 [bioreactor metagenome]|uniref:NAD-specific glutamate dehydrogenase n=1 Tax=bioreactor metagenome TaxID=1076179 RepID=A0A645I023_9ZZZZ